MGCSTGNATPPTPAIAPGSEEIDAEAVARELGERGPDPRLTDIVPAFNAPFFQAGLAGYSDAAMRIVARRHGCPLCVTEALLDRTLLAGGRGFAKADLGELFDNVPGGEDDHPLVGQIMGSNPAEMAAAALKMIEQGARPDRVYRQMAEHAPGPDPAATDDEDHADTFAAIDINLACPVKKIARKARGGHWLAEPDGAIAIVRAVREALPSRVPVTIKVRRSFDDTPEMARNFDRIMDACFEAGVAWATVHARTVQQKYIGPSRWDLLREIVRKNPGRVLLGSGDIWSAADIFRMLRFTGVA
ncbi:MAG: tRNA-dihydrouridine synthase family protein, partial [Phycisphaerales bacterium]